MTNPYIEIVSLSLSSPSIMELLSRRRDHFSVK